MDKVIFFEVLQERLKDANLSKLARDLKISKSLLHDWVSGRRIPSFRNAAMLKKLADYLGLEFEELFLGLKKGRKDKTISNVIFNDDEREYVVSVKRLK